MANYRTLSEDPEKVINSYEQPIGFMDQLKTFGHKVNEYARTPEVKEYIQKQQQNKWKSEADYDTEHDAFEDTTKSPSENEAERIAAFRRDAFDAGKNSAGLSDAINNYWHEYCDAMGRGDWKAISGTVAGAALLGMGAFWAAKKWKEYRRKRAAEDGISLSPELKEE